MEFPHGHDTQTHNHRRNDDEEERREHYPPPPPSSDQTAPPLHNGENEFAPPSPPYSDNYQEPPQPSRPYSSEPNYSPPPPPTSIQETKVFHTSHNQGDDPSLDYPPPATLVTHVSDEQIETHNCCRPHMPRFIQRHTHQFGFSYGVDLYNKLSFKVYSKAQPEFHLTIRDGKVILARSSPSDEFEVWKYRSFPFNYDLKLDFTFKKYTDFPVLPFVFNFFKGFCSLSLFFPKVYNI